MKRRSRHRRPALDRRPALAPLKSESHLSDAPRLQQLGTIEVLHPPTADPARRRLVLVVMRSLSVTLYRRASRSDSQRIVANLAAARPASPRIPLDLERMRRILADDRQAVGGALKDAITAAYRAFLEATERAERDGFEVRTSHEWITLENGDRYLATVNVTLLQKI